MANVKISNLTAAATPVAGTEVLPIVQSGATVKVSIANLTPGLDTITAAKGGTGQTSYAVGDLLYASTTTALSKLADVATGNALISGGVSTAPSYGKIGLTTHVSGTLPTANGGTNLTSFTANGVVYASSSSALATGSALTFSGSALAVTGSISSTGGFTSNTTITAQLDGSDSAGAGPGFNLFNTAFSRGWRTQLSASNNKVDYYFNGSAYVAATTIDTSGNLLVGTTSGNGARVLTKASTSDNSTFGIFCQNSSAATLFGVRSDGLFFTGTATNAPYNFTVVGSALYVNSSGQIGVLASVKKAKTNIVAAPTANWLNQLEVVNFNYRKKDVDGNYTDEAESKITWGVIADDAEKIAKDFCAYDSDGNLAGFHYDRLISPMLKAIQEQQALITQLTARITALESA